MQDRRTVYTARIRAMSSPEAVFDWMTVECGRITEMGAGPVPEQLAATSQVVSLDGRTVLPTLCDCHVHFLETGLLDVDLDLSAARTIEQLLELVAAEARTPKGRMLRAHSFDPDLMEDGRYPTAAELDAAAPGLPVLVRRRDGHSSVTNTAGAEFLRIDDGLDGIERSASKERTGVLRMRANTLAAARSREALSDEERVACFRSAARQAASRGVGVVHALVGTKDPANRDLELLLETQPSLPIETVLFAQTEDVERVAGLGLPRIGGCLLLDGSFSSGTAALEEPYADRGGRGALYYDDDQLTGFFRKAHARGLQISVHALGERAIAQALRCYRAACGGEAASARHRIEHCELPSPAIVQELVSLGVAACVQPTFELLWGGAGGMIEKRLGIERAARTNPYRTYLRAGVHLAGGSDSYVTPMDSLLGIHAAVHRPNPSEQLDVFDAVSLFTSGGAWISFDEHRRGTLEPGKEASFVVLDRDPFESPDDIRGVRVVDLIRAGVSIHPDPDRGPER